MVVGNTLSFIGPGNGRPLLVYFGENGQIAMKVAGPDNRIVNKNWFIKDDQILCRTFGQQNQNHCTMVGAAPEPDTLLMYSKELRYKAKILRGRQLDQ